MISVKDLFVEFGGRSLFEDVNFVINPREKVGLVGRNGTGKSTIFNLLLGKMQPTEGIVKIPDGYLVGCVSQYFHYAHNTVLDEVCSVLTEDREYETWKGVSILFGLGFTDEQMDQSPSLLSGGYHVKINLAKALLLEPNLLLLDEPTNYLDIYAIRWLKDFLKKWEGELILITHDRSFMDAIITNSLIIHRRQIRKVKGTVAKIKAQIAVEEEMYEKARQSQEKERQKTEEWIRKFRSKASMASRAKSMQNALDRADVKEKLEAIPSLDFDFTHEPYKTKDYMVTVNNLGFGYTDDKKLISDLDFSVKNGDKICVIGRNGNGKSTLLRLIYGALNGVATRDKPTPKEGTIQINDKVVCGYFGQMNVDRLNGRLSIRDEMASEHPELEEKIIRKTCSSMLFSGDSVYKKISVLSGGEKSRVMLGKILLNPCNLLLLDEPTNHFDMESSEALMEAVKNFEGAVIMVTHDEAFLQEIATKLIIFDGNKTFFFDGTYNKFIETIGWKE